MYLYSLGYRESEHKISDLLWNEFQPTPTNKISVISALEISFWLFKKLNIYM